jgi:hypothetical protein
MLRSRANLGTSALKIVGAVVLLSAVSSLLIGSGLAERGREQIQQEPKGAPVAVDDVAETDEGRVVDVVALGNDSSPDGYVLRVVSVTQGENGSVLINGDDTIRYQPNTGFAGLDGFAYTIADERGETATAAVSVRVNDIADAPVAEDLELQTDEDTTLVITLAARDADGDLLSFGIPRPPAKGSLGGTPPELSYTPDADYHGVDSFVFEVNDGQGGSDTGRVSIRIRPVDDFPLALDDEGETDQDMVVDIAVLGNDSSPDGYVLRVVSVTQGEDGSVLINGDDTIRYQPNTGFAGLDGFSYTITDGRNGAATAMVSVTVRRRAEP